jgi:hypothetical protein
MIAISPPAVAFSCGNSRLGKKVGWPGGTGNGVPRVKPGDIGPFPCLHQKICVLGHMVHAQRVNVGNLISTPDSLHG